MAIVTRKDDSSSYLRRKCGIFQLSKSPADVVIVAHFEAVPLVFEQEVPGWHCLHLRANKLQAAATLWRLLAGLDARIA